MMKRLQSLEFDKKRISELEKTGSKQGRNDRFSAERKKNQYKNQSQERAVQDEVSTILEELFESE